MKRTTQASQISKTKTPRGMATHLPAGALLRRYVQDTILSTFFKWGYREIIPPVFEYLDVLSSGLSSGLLEKSYKFVDRDSGKLMLLRPDITPQVAKMVAGILADEPKPLRLSNVICTSTSSSWSIFLYSGRTRMLISNNCLVLSNNKYLLPSFSI